MANIVPLPNLPFTDCTFKPLWPRETARMEGRHTETALFGHPWWTAEYTCGFIEKDVLGLAEAFYMHCSDEGGLFLAYDPQRPRPVLEDKGEPLSGMKATGGAFDGTASLQTIVDGRQIVVSGLPAGFQLSVGDYIEVRKSAATRSLHIITVAATANASGVVTLTIRYPLNRQIFATGNVVNFEKPSCVMQMDVDSWSLSKAWSARNPSFAAYEVFPMEAP